MARTYNYRGTEYSMAGLVELSGLSEGILYRRIRKEGWSVETAVETPRVHRCQHLEPRWKGKPLIVMFNEPVLSVFSWMQPILHKEYLAKPFDGTLPAGSAKAYYIITLDSGKPLIVYPNEFVVVREVS